MVELPVVLRQPDGKMSITRVWGNFLDHTAQLTKAGRTYPFNNLAATELAKFGGTLDDVNGIITFNDAASLLMFVLRWS